MKLKYFVVSTGRVLDTITVNGTNLRYETGAARPLFENRIAARGRVAAIAILKEWSNGYVATAPVDKESE